MESSIIKWCTSHFPHLTIIGLMLIAAIIITWRISKAYIHWTSRVKANETHGSRIDKDIIPRLTNIDQSINKLIVYLKTKHTDMDSQLFTVNSPLMLSIAGQGLLLKSGGKKYVDDNISALIEHMNELGIKSALDSQRLARYVIMEHMGEESFKPIKDYIFNNPKYKYEQNGEQRELDVDTDNMAAVMGVYLRDKYLETRPDLNVKDIP